MTAHLLGGFRIGIDNRQVDGLNQARLQLLSMATLRSETHAGIL